MTREQDEELRHLNKLDDHTPRMTDIVERLRAQITSDHVRGCMGRQYSCTCGYDAETEKLLAEAADEIERLRDALKAIECHSIDHTDACRMAGKARRTLQPKP